MAFLKQDEGERPDVPKSLPTGSRAKHTYGKEEGNTHLHSRHSHTSIVCFVCFFFLNLQVDVTRAFSFYFFIFVCVFSFYASGPLLLRRLESASSRLDSSSAFSCSAIGGGRLGLSPFPSLQPVSSSNRYFDQQGHAAGVARNTRC